MNERADSAAEDKESPPVSQGLGRVAVRGAKVLMLAQVARIVLQLAGVVVLARLLSPIEYGLFAMVLVVVGIAEVFRDFGLSAAAVQAPNLSTQQRDNLFWLNAVLGLALAAITVVSAELFSALFEQPTLAPLLQVVGLTFFVNGLAAQYKAGLTRDLRFAKLAISEVGTQALGLTVAILCAVGGLGVWALVWQQVSVSLFLLVIMVVMARWSPSRPRRGADTVRFLRFGRNMLLTQLIGYASNNVDSVVLGLRFGPLELGLYSRAYQLLMRPLNQLRVPTTSVAVPVLSRIQDDIPRSNVFLRKGQIALGYTIVVALAVMAGASTPLVALALGPQWQGAAVLLSCLTVAGIFQIPAYVGYWVYVSRGLTGDLFRYSLMTLCLQCLCIGVGSLGGVRGVAIGFAVAAGLEWPLSIWWLSRRTPIPVRDLMIGGFRIVALAGCVSATSWTLSGVLAGAPPIVALVAAGVGGLAAVGVCALLAPPVRADVRLVASVILRRSRRSRSAAAA